MKRRSSGRAAKTPPPCGRNTTARMSATSRSRPADHRGRWLMGMPVVERRAQLGLRRPGLAACPPQRRTSHACRADGRIERQLRQHRELAFRLRRAGLRLVTIEAIERVLERRAVGQITCFRDNRRLREVAMTCSKVRRASPRCFIASCQRPRSSSRPPGHAKRTGQLADSIGKRLTRDHRWRDAAARHRQRAVDYRAACRPVLRRGPRRPVPAGARAAPRPCYRALRRRARQVPGPAPTRPGLLTKFAVTRR